MDSQIFTTYNSEETRDLGKKIARWFTLRSEATKGKVICLYGELGAGKTTFTQGLAGGLGIKKNITSPTFILMREYQTRNPSTRNPLTLYHLDCYRLEKPQDTAGLGLKDLFNNPDNIICIEWAKKIKEFLPEKRTDIYFKNIGEDLREIKIIQIG
ncbi:MAG: tRNA (adenosine(37)-N6)-threonylcarbamoyltransferase complex ATPase subunit type 1 TsaE [Patescibacteria group bacterium]